MSNDMWDRVILFSVLVAAFMYISMAVTSAFCEGPGEDTLPPPLEKPTWTRCIVDNIEFNCLTLDESKHYLKVYAEYSTNRKRRHFLEGRLTLSIRKVDALSTYNGVLKTRVDQDTLLLNRVGDILTEESAAEFSVLAMALSTTVAFLGGTVLSYILLSLSL